MIPADSPQWLPARRGLLTASRMADAIAMLKNGKPSEARYKLMRDIVAERLTGVAVDHYVTPAMQWGIDHQNAARSAYEARSGNICGIEGLYEHPSIEFFAATPDATVGKDGLVEIKCPTTTTFLGWALEQTVPDEHKPQMLAQLACTQRKWVDFVAYDPRMPANLQLYIRRFEPTQEQIREIEDGARKFLNEASLMFDTISCMSPS